MEDSVMFINPFAFFKILSIHQYFFMKWMIETLIPIKKSSRKLPPNVIDLEVYRTQRQDKLKTLDVKLANR